MRSPLPIVLRNDPDCPFRRNLTLEPSLSGCSSSSCREVDVDGGLFSELEFGAIAPHAMQDHGKFAGDHDTRAMLRIPT